MTKKPCDYDLKITEQEVPDIRLAFIGHIDNILIENHLLVIIKGTVKTYNRITRKC
jgi:hypothetical protein